jgi:hypothetical protein
MKERHNALERLVECGRVKMDFCKNRTGLLEGVLSRLSSGRERCESGLLAAEQVYLQLKRAADAGHTNEQYEYWRCQRDGIGCEADCVGGAEYLRRSQNRAILLPSAGYRSCE